MGKPQNNDTNDGKCRIKSDMIFVKSNLNGKVETLIKYYWKKKVRLSGFKSDNCRNH
jgi:hypothetical protein